MMMVMTIFTMTDENGGASLSAYSCVFDIGVTNAVVDDGDDDDDDDGGGSFEDEVGADADNEGDSGNEGGGCEW
jgi:hypothetical protein